VLASCGLSYSIFSNYVLIPEAQRKRVIVSIHTDTRQSTRRLSSTTLLRHCHIPKQLASIPSHSTTPPSHIQHHTAKPQHLTALLCHTSTHRDYQQMTLTVPASSCFAPSRHSRVVRATAHPHCMGEEGCQTCGRLCLWVLVPVDSGVKLAAIHLHGST